MRLRNRRVEYIRDDVAAAELAAEARKPYSRQQLIEDHLAGLFMAVGLMAMAMIGFGLLFLMNLIQMFHGHDLVAAWSAFAITVGVVFGVYLVAGQVGAFAFFLLRPLRNNVFGWMLTGFALAMAAYGTMGLAIAVFFDPVGKVLDMDGTAEEAWELVRFTPWLGFFGMAGGAFYWGYQKKHPPLHTMLDDGSLGDNA